MVRTIVTSASHTRYGQLVEAATRVEQSAKTPLKSKSQFNQKSSWTGSHQGEASKMPKSGQRPAWSQSRQQSQRPQASQSSVRSSAGSRSQQSWRSRPVCSRCGRSHSGECLQGRTGCFRRGQEGHFMRDCPSAVTRVRQRPYLQLRGRLVGVVDPIGEAPRLEELLVHGSLVAEQVEAYP